MTYLRPVQKKKKKKIFSAILKVSNSLTVTRLGNILLLSTDTTLKWPKMWPLGQVGVGKH